VVHIVPKVKRTPKIATKLQPADHQRFEIACNLTGKTKTELAREAILRYIDQIERGQTESHDSKIEKRLKAMEDRYASLLVRVGLDVGTLVALMSSRIPAKDRRELMDTCYKVSVQHFNKKLEGTARDMKQSLSAMARTEEKNA
jgi:histidinol phosphatase-like PHP family hydrolase